MTELIKTGKNRTILVSISILLVSLDTIYFYHINNPELEVKKLIQQITRLVLTFGLLSYIYKGKKWAKITLIILLSLSIPIAINAIYTTEGSIVSKTPLFVMILVYSFALFHFGISKSYKAFYEYQNSENEEIE